MAFIGQIIDDKYEILKLIGKGGMSKVYLAMDKRLNKQWAVKEIEKDAHDENSEIIIESAIAEASLIKGLDHPSIVRIVDIINGGDVIYIIEDYVEGETLKDIVDRNGPQPQQLVVDWAKQICKALEYLHTRTPAIIYRDMKPANVMLKPDGNVIIIDFGIAREHKDSNVEDTVWLGTRGYAAPEQFGGMGQQTDARTDIYCLGVTMYHLLTGKNPSEPPYEVYPIRHWDPHLSPGLEAVIEQCTQLDPDKRYQSCIELLYALEHYEENGKLYIEYQKKRLRRFLYIVAAFVLMVVMGVGGIVMMNVTNNNDFDMNIMQAEKAVNSKEKISYYVKAIEIKPKIIDTYFSVVKAFKSDAMVDEEENVIIKKSITPHLKDMQDDSRFAELNFEFGKLYWYYNSDGKENTTDNQITRMKSAVTWFEDALRYGKEDDSFRKMANTYKEIGSFHSTITLSEYEAEDKDMYAPYFRSIEDLVESIQDTLDESEIVNLEIFKLTVDAVESYPRKFKKEGVTKDEMTRLLDAVQKANARTVAYTDRSEAIKDYVEKHYSTAMKAVDNAFSNGKVQSDGREWGIG